MEETATFALAGAAITVANSVIRLIDASPDVRLFSTRVGSNREIRQEQQKRGI